MRTAMWLSALAIVAAGAYFLRADDPKPAPAKAGSEFTGRLVYVQTRGGPKGLAIENSSVRVMGGRPFLVGKSTADEAVSWKTYFTGTEVWLPVDEIEAISVFENLTQLKRAAGQ